MTVASFTESIWRPCVNWISRFASYRARSKWSKPSVSDKTPNMPATMRKRSAVCGRPLSQVDHVFKVFRARFTGKASPVQFYWGGIRSGGCPIFRAHRAPASGGDAQLRGLGHAGGLLPRSRERRLLASCRTGRGRLLCLYLPGAGGLWFVPGPACYSDTLKE